MDQLYIFQRERARLNESRSLILNQDNRSQWYYIISKKETSGTGLEVINWDCLC